MSRPQPKKDDGPGVPEAVPRAVQHLGARFGPEALERLWIFPPMISGRRERGLVTASRHPDDADDDRRILVTAVYFGERTGKGLEFAVTIDEQGIAPPDAFPRVMEGVVRRAGEDLGEAREVELDGDAERFEDLLGEFDFALLDPELPPLAGTVEEEDLSSDAEAASAPAVAAKPKSSSALDHILGNDLIGDSGDPDPGEILP